MGKSRGVGAEGGGRSLSGSVPTGRPVISYRVSGILNKWSEQSCQGGREPTQATKETEHVQLSIGLD